MDGECEAASPDSSCRYIPGRYRTFSIWNIERSPEEFIVLSLVPELILGDSWPINLGPTGGLFLSHLRSILQLVAKPTVSGPLGCRILAA